MRQSSGQNMHGQWLRDPVILCLAAISALKESSHFKDFSILHCSRRGTISVSAYYIRDLFCGPTCVLEVFRKRAGGRGGGLLHMNINLDSTNIIITGHKIVASFFLQHFLLSISILGAIFMHTSIFSS